MKSALVLFPMSTLGRGRSAFDWWTTAAAEFGISVETAFFEDIVLEYNAGKTVATINGNVLHRPDFVVVRGYNAELSMHFEALGVRVFNPWLPMMLSRDKVLTHQCLSRAGVPFPRTLRAFGGMTYGKAVELLGGTFIVKAVQGSCGDGVFLVHDAAEYDAAVEACAGECLLQEYIEMSRGRDIRVWTVGGRAVACVMRSSADSFRSNYSCGGSASPYELTPQISALAEAASQALKLDFAGVDILLGPTPCVCEVNGNAGFRTLSAVGGPDILKILFEYIDNEVYGNA